MVEYVINALEEAKEIQKIVIVGPKEIQIVISDSLILLLWKVEIA